MHAAICEISSISVCPHNGRVHPPGGNCADRDRSCLCHVGYHVGRVRLDFLALRDDYTSLLERIEQSDYYTSLLERLSGGGRLINSTSTRSLDNHAGQ